MTDPADDPVLTVRMEPPDTQARRLNLCTRRAVRVSGSDIAPWCYVGGHVSTFIEHADVADWPVVSLISVGAAQRLQADRLIGPCHE